MAKLKNPVLGFDIRGSLAHVFSFRGRGKQTIIETTPRPTDIKSPAQLSWRHMYQKAAALWHDLSADEKTDWETGARIRHMTGFAWFMSQCLKPNPGIYLPLQGGTMQGDIDMATHKITDLPQPTADQEAATKKYADDVGGAAPHADTHETTGADEISIAALLGEPASLTTHKAQTAGVHDFGKSARVYNNANLSIPHSTETTLTFNSERWDTDGIHSTISNTGRLTCKTTGIYLIIAQVIWAANAAGYRELKLYHNANRIAYEKKALTSDNYCFPFLTTLANLAVNDYVTATVYQTTGGNLNALYDPCDSPEFMMARIA